MSVYWMVSIFLGCVFSQSTQDCNCNDKLKTVCAVPGQTVHIPCPKLENKNLMFILYKNEEPISNCVFNSTNKTSNCSHKVFSDITESENQTGFKLTVTNASIHGIYVCKRRNFFPPPIETHTGPSKILVLVQGHQCLSKTEEVHKSMDGMDFGPVWIAVLVFLCIYSLIVSVIAVVTWVKLKSSDSYSDYMNTKPRPSKDRKKRGIQTPTPRHF